MVILSPQLYDWGPSMEHVSVEEVINLVAEWAIQTVDQLFRVGFETVLEL